MGNIIYFISLNDVIAVLRKQLLLNLWVLNEVASREFFKEFPFGISSNCFKLTMKFRLYITLGKFEGNECESVGELSYFWVSLGSPFHTFFIKFWGLSFPKIRSSDENVKLVNFLRNSIFDKITWTDDYASQHNISVFGKRDTAK